jgi:hypothetical protein
MGWVHSKERNRLAADTTEMITAIKLHYDSFAPVKLSSTQQAKRARFDAAVASSVAEGDSLAGAAELPAGLWAQIATTREAATADAGAEGEGEEVEQLTAGELSARLDQLTDTLQPVQPPGGFATWVEAVQDAFGGGWDGTQDDLLNPSYAEEFAAPVVQVRPPTFGQFDPAAMVQAELQQQQQQLSFATQQMLLQGFQRAGMADVASSLQQHVLLQQQQQYMQQ